MKILITTEPDDNHAVLVQLAMEASGHDVRLLFIADQPSRQSNSVYIDNFSYQWKNEDKYASFMDHDYDIVWWRRPRKPYVPEKSVHPKDYPFIVRENHLFYESITNNISQSAWWINPKDAAIRANSKLLQLRIALECGLSIPTTLCSNSPKDIRYFLLKHETDGVIYKPLCPGVWFEHQRLKLAYTSKINFSDLPNNDLLQLAPGIFQKEIKKAFELRIVCFGDFVIAAKINSQEHPEGITDWRAIPEGELTIEPYTLPVKLAEKIRLFMRKMGLVFGSLDFIVTRLGEYIFLEVNEQGQFLWLESYNPEIKILDMFIHFLVNQSTHFNWQKSRATHTVEHYQPHLDAVMTKNCERHIDLNRVNRHKELS